MFNSHLSFPNPSPACPIDVLPEPLRGAVLYAVHEKVFPAAVALTDSLAAAAAVVHCGFDCVAPDGERLPATINTCVVAPSATGKGRSMRLFFKHFLGAQKRQRARRDEGPDRCNPTGSAPTSLVEAMVSTISIRRLIQELDGFGMNLTIQREEGASFLKTDLFKHGTDALTQLWSGDPPLDHFVMGRELVAAEARLSLAFRIQPELMYDHLKRRGRLEYKLGFWPRTIAACHDPERFPGNEGYLSACTRSGTDSAFQDRMTELAGWINTQRDSFGADRIGIELDAEASAFLLELGYRMKSWATTYYPDIREAAGRAWENTLRVAVVLRVFCVGPGKVSLDLVLRAWAIVEWSLSQHRLIFVEAIAPAPVRAAFPPNPYSAPRQTSGVEKPSKLPRPLQDAQWVLTCLDRMRTQDFMRKPTLIDLRLLANLPEKRLSTAMAWLKLEGIVDIDRGNHDTLIRYSKMSSSGSALTIF